MRPTRLLTAFLAAFLLVCGIPAAALAETDVVLSNESEGTNVTTGESSFSNSENTNSSSASFDAADSDSIAATQTAPGSSTTGTPTLGQATVAPTVSAPTGPSAGPIKAQVSRAVASVDDLFVGFSIGSSSISP